MMICPHLILKKENKILLTRRSPTNKIWSNHWHLVTGTIEAAESPQETIIREAAEEVGLKIKNPTLETTMFLVTKDYFDPMKQFYALELFFVSRLDDDQEPLNLEPAKQDALGWFDPHQLPEPMIAGVAFGIKSYFNNQRYVELRHV